MRDLAKLADVSTASILKLESGVQVRGRTAQAIQGALEGLGASFLTDDGEGPGVRFRPQAPGTPEP